MKTKILYALFMVVTFSAFAQEEDEEKKDNVNSNRKYKNEIGIDISAFNFILDNSGGGYPSLFFRRHFTKEKSVKSLSGVKVTSFHAYRFRVGSNLSFEKFNTPNIKKIQLTYYNYFGSSYDQGLTNRSSFFIRIGKEKQIRSKRFELFYGYDFFINYDDYRSYTLYVQILNPGQPDLYNINEEIRYNERTISLGAAVIGGFKYFLIPRLCFSAEATVDLKFYNNKHTNKLDRFNTSNQELIHDGLSISSNGVKLGINPMFVVNAGYYF